MVTVGSEGDGHRRRLGNPLTKLSEAGMRRGLPAPEPDPETSGGVEFDCPANHPVRVQRRCVLGGVAVGAPEPARVRDRYGHVPRSRREPIDGDANLVQKDVQPAGAVEEVSALRTEPNCVRHRRILLIRILQGGRPIELSIRRGVTGAFGAGQPNETPFGGSTSVDRRGGRRRVRPSGRKTPARGVLTQPGCPPTPGQGATSSKTSLRADHIP